MRLVRSVQIVPAISEEASGPSYSVVRLCESLIEQGQQVTLAALDWAPVPSAPAFYRSFPLGLGPRRLGRSPAMARWLNSQADAGEVALIHNHGMWQMNAIYPAWASGKGNVSFIQSPRGALSSWAMNHGSPAKKLFWPLLQKPALKKVACFHATANSEYEDIRRLGFRQPVAVIPNGIDVPPLYEKTGGTMRTLLFLGRIHPKKGLDMLLPAWGAVQASFPNWQLCIVGSDSGYGGPSGYLAKLKLMATELGLERIEFSGELLAAAKLQAYREAELFVLPTFSENFGMTVAESLAAGTAAIVTKGAPWHGLNTECAGKWVEIGLDPLVAALEDMLSRPSGELSMMGQRGRSWMEREYSWNNIGRQMAGVYDWVLGHTTSPPDCIKID